MEPEEAEGAVGRQSVASGLGATGCPRPLASHSRMPRMPPNLWHCSRRVAIPQRTRRTSVQDGGGGGDGGNERAADGCEGAWRAEYLFFVVVVVGGARQKHDERILSFGTKSA